jgi:nicotinate-nucleotide adenylyltransferase
MMQSRRIGILGGMFDPIHCGHLDVGAAAQRRLHLTDVLVVPSNLPPHRDQPVASSHHRFAMAALAVAGLPGWRALDLELRGTGRSYTSDTLRHFHARGYRPSELFFLTGADAFLEIATWKDYPALFEFAHFAVVARPRVPVGELPARLPELAERMRMVAVQSEPLILRQAQDERTLIFLIDAATADVSSTAIRETRNGHRSITGLVPPSVQQHIEQHDLYESPTPAGDASDGSRGAKAGRLHGQD